MIKKLLLLVVAISLLTFGCATVPTNPEPQDVNLKVTVEATNDQVVLVEEDDGGPVYEPVSDPYLKPSNMMLLSRTQKLAFVRIYSGLSVADVSRLWQDITYLFYDTDYRRVKLFINSGGGGAFAGIALADLIIRAQDIYGITFEAHASGIIASAAVPVFAVCDHRIAASGTIFMVHEAALWKWPGKETASMIRAQNALMDLLRERYFDKLVGAGRSKLSAEQWEELEKVTTWFSADDAMTKYGIVDEVE